ncbi:MULTISPECIES: polysialyltransferase family glycosyltransferase [Burkholderia]|uniref:Uncharacterized protein n=1 Tax=Burkholderia paludis TaxID=1506587 RepID=A0A6J5DZ07_9BURK|nr:MULTISPECIES: polysialyltransferase family glycosyltransferase [Burkholderia]CAB3758206.1 hypothetical protein LMG30113_03133 [Burkholderia paludis]VWB99293.1 hypothetical protein BPA30113_04644 [Burkholderia paludis]
MQQPHKPRIGQYFKSAIASLVRRQHHSSILRDEVASLKQQLIEYQGQVTESLKAQSIGLDTLGGKLTNSIENFRPKRLFISTGFFSTAIAATIALQGDACYDDYLLVPIDRQSESDNIQWAYQANDSWIDVKCIPHSEYYNHNNDSKLPFSEIEFDSIFSPFIEMTGFIEENFHAKKHHYFEEGITSYLQVLRETKNLQDTLFYALSPSLLRNSSVITPPVSGAIFREIFIRNNASYRVPIFENPRNILILATGAPPDHTGDPLAALSAYVPIAQAMINAGVDVWLHPHPRVSLGDTFGTSELARAGVRLIETDAPLVESVIVNNREKISAIVSIYSSLTVHALTLFGIPAFSVHAAPPDEKQAWWKAIQDAAIPDAECLLHASSDELLHIANSFHNQNIGWAPTL